MKQNGQPGLAVAVAIVAMSLAGAPARQPETPAGPPLTPELRFETVQAACSALQEAYVFPEVADEMAASVRARLSAGDYDAITTEAALAARLTDDFRAVSRDMHLRVRVAPQRSEAPAPRADRGSPARENYLFRRAEVLDGNIGYIRFDGFLEGPGAEKTASAALAFVAHCDALVFDMRCNGGGSPEMIRYITSYLFDEPTHLNDMIDRDGNIVEEYWTLKDVPGTRFAPDLPVYVLTSSRTFSGAEEFSYNLKSLKRATIIGETTGGGAHPTRAVRLNDRFIIGVPFMRASNPITRTNWEGKGVEPDIAVPAAEALDRALEEARRAILARERGSTGR